MAKNSSILQLPYFLINKNSYRRKIRDIVLDALDSKLAVSPKRYISEEKQLSKRVPVVTKSHPEFCPELWTLSDHFTLLKLCSLILYDDLGHHHRGRTLGWVCFYMSDPVHLQICSSHQRATCWSSCTGKWYRSGWYRWYRSGRLYYTHCKELGHQCFEDWTVWAFSVLKVSSAIAETQLLFAPNEKKEKRKRKMRISLWPPAIFILYGEY